jgi:hypothetical protein
MGKDYSRLEKIVGYKTWSDKKKIDELLKIDCDMYTNLGIDSTSKDRSEVKKTSKYIYRAIQKMDPIIGKSLLFYAD